MGTSPPNDIRAREIKQKSEEEIHAALAWVDEECEMYHASGDDDMLREMRRIEVLVKKLAREASYDAEAIQ